MKMSEDQAAFQIAAAALKQNAAKRESVNTPIIEEKPAKRQVSALVGAKMWEQFTEINRKNGMTNNSCVNMLIMNFIRENRAILEE